MRAHLTGTVGRHQQNRRDDVLLVQRLLNKHAGQGRYARVAVDGIYGRHTHQALSEFQTRVLKMGFPDGVVSTNSGTFRKLLGSPAPPPPEKWRQTGTEPQPTALPSPAPSSSGQATSGGPAVPLNPALANSGEISDAEYRQAGATIGVEAAVLKALTAVECNRPAFDSQGRPVILFERVHFSRMTHHSWDRTNPDASLPDHLYKVKDGKYLMQAGHKVWDKQQEYGHADQYARLEEAARLDHNAALQSASWGKFQIMGFHYKDCGFPSVDAFVHAMETSAGAQIQAFATFAPKDKGLHRALKSKDWPGIARRYNGDLQVAHYAALLKSAYQAYQGIDQR